MAHDSRVNQSVRVLMVGVFALTLALAGLFSFARPAQASENYEVVTTNIPTVTNAIYAVPGEKVTIKLGVKDWSEYKDVKASEYVVSSSSLKNLAVSGNTIVVGKAPKAGKYTFKVTAKDADGSRLAAKTFKLVTKKKPALKIAMQTRNDKGAIVSKNAKSVKQGNSFILLMKGADFGWDNNTKKPFYTWSVKDLDTGKTVKWNTKYGSFKKNSFVSGSSVAGGGCPSVFGSFKRGGRFKITATMYHSNKKIATATKTIMVFYAVS